MAESPRNRKSDHYVNATPIFTFDELSRVPTTLKRSSDWKTAFLVLENDDTRWKVWGVWSVKERFLRASHSLRLICVELSKLPRHEVVESSQDRRRALQTIDLRLKDLHGTRQGCTSRKSCTERWDRNVRRNYLTNEIVWLRNRTVENLKELCILGKNSWYFYIEINVL